MPKPVSRIVTHWGSFHADDVLACYVLLQLHPRAHVLRTRDPKVLSSTDDRDVVIDVGFEYDPARRRYDHHQPGHPLRDDGVPYSSFGLVWLHHGREYLRLLLPDDSGDVVECVWMDVDRNFVSDIDRADNGYVAEGESAVSYATSLSMMVEDLVPSWDDPDQDTDSRFMRAVREFGPTLERRSRRSASLARAEEAVLRAFREAEDPRVVVIPDFMPVGSVVERYGFDDALYLVERSRSGDWFVNCVRPAGEPFGQRKPLPAEWAGLRDADLAAVSGVPDAVFCHIKRFTCAARSLDGALSLARAALDMRPERNSGGPPPP